MDIKQYITSGILEKYVLGLASPAEQQEVRQYAEQYPEVQQELEKIEVAMELYAQTNEAELPEGMETKIDAKIDAVGHLPTPKPSSRGLSAAARWLRFLLPALALLALLVYWFQQQATQYEGEVERLENEVARVEGDLQQLKTNCDQIQAENDRLIEDLLLIRDANTRSTIIRGTDNAPDAVATIYRSQEKAYLDVLQLAAPPSDQQYELWAIVNKKPVSMGVFDLKASTGNFQEVPLIENATAFAVTLELKDGDPAPNLEQMVLYGAV